MHIYRRTSVVKAMTFDLDDTLYDNWPVIQNVEQKMVVWLHTHHPVSTLMSIEQWQVLKHELAIQNPNLKHDVTLWRETQIQQGLIQLGYDEPEATSAAKEGMEHALWLRNQVDVPELTHEVMTILAEKFPLIAITNGNVDPDKIGLGQYFSHVLKAGPDGRAKPYADMFARAVDLLGLPAESILHVGDHLITDVYGAKSNGFQACWYNDQRKNIQHCEKVRVLPDIEVNSLRDLLYFK
ncbi:5-amino-6-(5-phospho-D-ribitylamino)uracil phosphatase YigB [Vibrio cortegadensis]|uniref:5-amino-6-(5-phospho-D-ribitylamino)uracil phosphatase YigB n=1 Tax=Vibrio cortegadensis TaxID=1328770 RepID=UPI00352FE2C6